MIFSTTQQLNNHLRRKIDCRVNLRIRNNTDYTNYLKSIIDKLRKKNSELEEENTNLKKKLEVKDNYINNLNIFR